MTFPFGWTSHPVTCDHRQRVNTGTGKYGDGRDVPQFFSPNPEWGTHAIELRLTGQPKATVPAYDIYLAGIRSNLPELSV
jgi:hypothetical protein